MRSKVAIVFVILLIMGLFPGFDAVNDQGLFWGVEVGNRIHYRIQGENMDGLIPVVNWSVYFEIERMGDLNQTIAAWSDIAVYSPYCPFYWNNGSSYWSGIGWLAVLPVGNWTLIEELFLDYNIFLTEENTTETATTWGYTIHQLAGLDTQTVTVAYSKIDGVFNYHLAMWEYEDGSPTQLVEFIREDNQSGIGGLDNNIVLYISIGAGVVVLLIVVIVVVRRY